MKDDERTNEVTCGNICIPADPKSPRITLGEMQMLQLIMINPGVVTTHRQILISTYGTTEWPQLKILTIRFHHLLKKLKEAGLGSGYLRSVWGRGFLYLPNAQLPAQDEVSAQRCIRHGLGTFTDKWIASRKQLVVEAVASGWVTQPMLQSVFLLTEAELGEWRNGCKAGNRHQLKVTEQTP